MDLSLFVRWPFRFRAFGDSFLFLISLKIVLPPVVSHPSAHRVRIDSPFFPHRRRGLPRRQNMPDHPFPHFFRILRVIAWHGWVISYLYIWYYDPLINFHTNPPSKTLENPSFSVNAGFQPTIKKAPFTAFGNWRSSYPVLTFDLYFYPKHFTKKRG